MQLHALYTNETLRERLVNTSLYLLLYLFGLNIILPFVSLEMLSYMPEANDESLAGLLHGINENTSSIHNVSILALGVSAYYSASIITAIIVPFLYREKAGNEEAIRYLVKGLTFLFLISQASSYSQSLARWFFAPGAPSYAVYVTMIILVTGAFICMWIADQISAQGLMDGRICLLCIGFLRGFPSAFVTELSDKLIAGDLLQLGIELGIWILIIVGIVAFTQAVRYFPLPEGTSPKVEALTNPNLRIRLNVVDESPLYIATQFIMLPLIVIQAANPIEGNVATSSLLLSLADSSSLLSMVFNALVVVVATYLIVGILLRAGRKTARTNNWEESVLDLPEERSYQVYFWQVFRRLRLPLALIFALISILPSLSVLVFDTTSAFRAYFGGFSLFLLISLLTDFFSNVEQMASDSPSIIGRSTTPDLDFIYELEYEYEEEE
ncbi:MAG: hypothetical protein AAFO03_11365 [Bacteroidota bacterium]